MTKVKEYVSQVELGKTLVVLLASVASFFVIRTLSQVDESLRTTALSVQELNKTVAQVVVEISHQKKDLDSQSIRIDLHENRIRSLEINRGGK